MELEQSEASAISEQLSGTSAFSGSSSRPPATKWLRQHDTLLEEDASSSLPTGVTG